MDKDSWAFKNHKVKIQLSTKWKFNIGDLVFSKTPLLNVFRLALVIEWFLFVFNMPNSQIWAISMKNLYLYF